MSAWEWQAAQDPEMVPDEWVWERLRIKRNRDLASSDWTVLADSPVDVEAWKVYRQQLRDLPDHPDAPRDVEWPQMPT